MIDIKDKEETTRLIFSSNKNMSSLIRKIIEGNKKLGESYQYIKEDFMGMFPIGIHFKSYQNNFLDTFVSSIDKNYFALPKEIKDDIKKSEVMNISFKEDDVGSFIVSYNLLENSITKSEAKICIAISIVDDELNLNIITDSAKGIVKNEIEKLVKSYTNINFVFENFSKLVDTINEFTTNFIYLYFKYIISLTSYSEVLNDVVYNTDVIDNFLNYLENEVKREIFCSPIATKYVDFVVDKSKYLISVNVKTYNRIGYLIVDYIFSPETAKFKKVSFASSLKESKISLIKELSVEVAASFINDLKSDIQSIFNKPILEAKSYSSLDGTFKFDIKKYNLNETFTKTSKEYKYFESTTTIPEGIEYDHSTDKYIVENAKLDDLINARKYKKEGIIRIPRTESDDLTEKKEEIVDEVDDKDEKIDEKDTNKKEEVEATTTPADVGKFVNSRLSDKSDMVKPKIATPFSKRFNKKETESFGNRPSKFGSVNRANRLGRFNETSDDLSEDIIFPQKKMVTTEPVYGGANDYSLVDNNYSEYPNDYSDDIKFLDVNSIEDGRNFDGKELVYLSELPEDALRLIESIKTVGIEETINTIMSNYEQFNTDYAITTDYLSDMKISPNDVVLDSGNYTVVYNELENKFALLRDEVDLVLKDDYNSFIPKKPDVNDKEIIYTSQNPQDANMIINDVLTEGLKKVINRVISKYRKESKSRVMTNDYIKDLKVTSKDKFLKEGKYTFIYNEANQTACLLKDEENDKENEKEELESYKVPNGPKFTKPYARLKSSKGKIIENEEVKDEEVITNETDKEEVQDEVKDNLTDGKEVIFLAKDEEESEKILEVIEKDGEDAAIDLILSEVEKQSELDETNEDDSKKEDKEESKNYKKEFFPGEDKPLPEGFEIVEDDKGLFGIKYNGELIIDYYYSYIDDVMNYNGMVRVKDENGKSGSIDLLSYISENYKKEEKESDEDNEIVVDPTDTVLTDDYIQDLEIDSSDEIYTKDDYILVYDIENKEVALLKEIESNDENEELDNETEEQEEESNEKEEKTKEESKRKMIRRYRKEEVSEKDFVSNYDFSKSSDAEYNIKKLEEKIKEYNDSSIVKIMVKKLGDGKFRLTYMNKEMSKNLFEKIKKDIENHNFKIIKEIKDKPYEGSVSWDLEDVSINKLLPESRRFTSSKYRKESDEEKDEVEEGERLKGGLGAVDQSTKGRYDHDAMDQSNRKSGGLSAKDQSTVVRIKKGEEKEASTKFNDAVVKGYGATLVTPTGKIEYQAKGRNKYHI